MPRGTLGLMPSVYRQRTLWSGSAVSGPGVTTWFWNGPPTDAAAIAQAFFTTVKGRFPGTLTWSFPASQDEIDIETGSLVGTWDAGSAGDVSETGALNFVRGAGARIAWETAGIVGGRRVRGTTFLAPLTTTSFTSAGVPSVSTLGDITTAATALVEEPSAALVIYSRPTATRAGAISQVTGFRVPAETSWLRSRRT